MSMGEQAERATTCFGFREFRPVVFALKNGGVLHMHELCARLTVSFQFFKGKTFRQHDGDHQGNGIAALDGNHVFFESQEHI